MSSPLERRSDSPKASQRYEGLDQLRGILAFSVMIYHYAEWHRFTLPWLAQKPLELLGIYAVGTFYILSGCALFIVYQKQTIDSAFFKEFWIKRIFRIVPLFWMASLLVVLTQKPPGQEWDQFLDPWRLFLNFTLLFSWLDPRAYYATGAWSIGNEWAFYSLFPLIMWAARKPQTAALLFIVTCAITSWYAFFIIRADLSVEEQWQSYIHPLNQLILFVSGMLLGRRVVKAEIRKRLPARVYLAGLSFIVISYYATVPACVSGVGRFVLIGICIVCCEGFAVTRSAQGKITTILTFLGTISYTVYLMHPIVHHAVSKILGKIHSMIEAGIVSQQVLSWSVFSISIVSTILASSTIYWKIEKPAIRIGRRMVGKFQATPVN